MLKTRTIPVQLLAYASGLAGADPLCGKGPLVLQKNSDLSKKFSWALTLQPSAKFSDLKTELTRLCQELALKTKELAAKKEFFMVLGGDHSSAIGTWSGVHEAVHKEGSFGLIWIDAHMDSHIPETSPSGRFHGMPLAALLGEGDSNFTQLLNKSPKLNPQQVCLIGVRSFEAGEAEILKNKNVKIFYMPEVQERGLAAVFADALKLVNQGTIGYGISLDIDSIDPSEAPGVDVPEPEGLSAQELLAVLTPLAQDPRLLAVELVEFDPYRDVQGKTERLVLQLLSTLSGVPLSQS